MNTKQLAVPPPPIDDSSLKINWINASPSIPFIIFKLQILAFTTEFVIPVSNNESRYVAKIFCFAYKMLGLNDRAYA